MKLKSAQLEALEKVLESAKSRLLEKVEARKRAKVSKDVGDEKKDE